MLVRRVPWLVLAVSMWWGLCGALAAQVPAGSQAQGRSRAAAGADAATPASGKLLKRLDTLLGRPARRAFVPAAEPRAWPPGSWTPVPTERFIQALRELPTSTQGMAGQGITTAIYVLQWDDVEATSVVGHFVWAVGSARDDGSLELDESDLVVTGLFDAHGRRVPWGRNAGGRLRIVAGASRLLLGKCVLPTNVAGSVGRIAGELPAANTRWVVVRGRAGWTVEGESRDVAAYAEQPDRLPGRWAELLRLAADRDTGAKAGRDAEAGSPNGAADEEVQGAVSWLWRGLAENLRPTTRPLPGGNSRRNAPNEPDGTGTGTLPVAETPASDAAAGRRYSNLQPLSPDVRVRSFFLPPYGPAALVMQPLRASSSRTDRSREKAPLLFYRHRASWSVRQTSVEVVADFSIEPVGGALSEIRLAIPAELRIFGVRLGDTAVSTWSVSAPRTPVGARSSAKTGGPPPAGPHRVLSIHLAERLSDEKVLVRVEGTRPISLGGVRRLDCMRPIGGDEGEISRPVLVDGRIRLLIAPEVEIGAWHAVGMRQVAPLEPFDQSFRTEFRMFSPTAAIDLPVYLPRSRLQARQWILLRPRTDRLVAEAFVECADSAERTFEVSCTVGDGWAVSSVRRLEQRPGSRFDWQVTQREGRTLLRIVLADALGEQPQRFAIHLATRKPDFMLPPLRVRSAQIRELLLGVAATAAGSLRFDADTLPVERLSDGAGRTVSETIRRWSAAARAASDPSSDGTELRPDKTSASPSSLRREDASGGGSEAQSASKTFAVSPSRDVAAAVRLPAAEANGTPQATGSVGDPQTSRTSSGAGSDQRARGKGTTSQSRTAEGAELSAGESPSPDRPPEPSSQEHADRDAIQWWRFPAGEAWVNGRWQRSRSAAFQAVIEVERSADGWKATYRLQPQRRQPLPLRLYVVFTEPLPDTTRWSGIPEGVSVRARRVTGIPTAAFAVPPRGELWEIVPIGPHEENSAVVASVSWPDFPERLPLAIVADDPRFVGYVTVRLPRGHGWRFDTSGMYRLAGDLSADTVPTTARKSSRAGGDPRFLLRRDLQRPARGGGSVVYRWTYRTPDARIACRRPTDGRDVPVVGTARWLAWLATRWSEHDLHRIELRLSRPVRLLNVRLPPGLELVGALLDGRPARLVRADGSLSARGVRPMPHGGRLVAATGTTQPATSEGPSGSEASNQTAAKTPARPGRNAPAERTATADAGSAGVLTLPGAPDQVFGTVELHLRSQVRAGWLSREHTLHLPQFGSVQVGSIELIARDAPGTHLDGPPAFWNEFAESGANGWWRRIGGPLVRTGGGPPFNPLSLEDWRRLAGVDAGRQVTVRLQHPLVGPFEDAWQTALRQRLGYCVGAVATHAMAERPVVFRSVSQSFVRAIAWLLLLVLTLAGLAMRATQFRWRHAVAIGWAATACVCIGLIPDAYAEWAGSITLALAITVLCPRSVFRTVEPADLSGADALATTVAMPPGSHRAVGVVFRILLWVGCVVVGVRCACVLAQGDGAQSRVPAVPASARSGSSTNATEDREPATVPDRPSFDLLIPIEKSAVAGSEVRPAGVVYLSEAVFRRLFAAQPKESGGEVLFENAEFVVSYDPELNVAAQARFAFSVRRGRPARLLLPLEGMNPLAETCRLDGQPVRLQSDPQGRLFWQSEVASAPDAGPTGDAAGSPPSSASGRSDSAAPPERSADAEWVRHVLSVEIRPPLAGGDATGQLRLPACRAGVTLIRIRSPREIRAVETDVKQAVVWSPPVYPQTPREGRLKAAVFCNAADSPWTARWFADVAPAPPQFQVHSLDDYLVRPQHLERTVVLSLAPGTGVRADFRSAATLPRAVQVRLPLRAVVRSVGLADGTHTHDIPFTIRATDTGEALVTAWLPAPASESIPAGRTATEPARQKPNGQAAAEGQNAPEPRSEAGAQAASPARRRIVLLRLWQPYDAAEADVHPQGGNTVRVAPLEVKLFCGYMAARVSVQTFAAFRADAAYRLVFSPENDSELRRVTLQETELLFGDRAPHGDAVAFRLLNPVTVTLGVLPVAGERRVSLSYLGQVDARELVWTIDATIDVTGAAVYRHVIELDADLQIDTISVMANDAEQLLRWTREDGHVVLHLRTPAIGRQTLTLRTRRTWTQGVPLSLPLVRIEGARVDAARARLLGSDDVQIRWVTEVTATGGAAPGSVPQRVPSVRPITELDLTGVQAAPQMVVQLRPRAPVVEMVIGLALPDRHAEALEPEAVPVAVTVAARLTGQAMPQAVSWVIPDRLASGLQLGVSNGTAFGPTRLEKELQLDVVPEAGSDTVTVVMRSQFVVSPADRTLPLPRLRTGAVSRTYVVWNADGELSVGARIQDASKSPLPAEELSVQDLPAWARSLQGIQQLGAVARVLATTESPGAITLELARRAAAAPPARDGLQWTWLYVQADGRVSAETQLFLVEPGAAWKLRWNAAPVELHAVEVDSRPVDLALAAPDASGQMELPLDGEAGVVRVVRLVWSSRLTRPLVSGTVRLPGVVSPDLPAERHVSLLAAAPGIVLRPRDVGDGRLRSTARKPAAEAVSLASVWLDVARATRYPQVRSVAAQMAAMLLDAVERRTDGEDAGASTGRFEAGEAKPAEGPPAVSRQVAEDSTPVPPPMPLPRTDPLTAPRGRLEARQGGSAELVQLRSELRTLAMTSGEPFSGTAEELISALLVAVLARSTQRVALGEPPREYYWVDLRTGANALMFVVALLAIGSGAACRRVGVVERLHRWPGAMWLLLGAIWWACFVPSVLGLLFIGFGIADLSRRLFALWVVRRPPIADTPSGFTSSVVERFPGM